MNSSIDTTPVGWKDGDAILAALEDSDLELSTGKFA